MWPGIASNTTSSSARRPTQCHETMIDTLPPPPPPQQREGVHALPPTPISRTNIDTIVDTRIPKWIQLGHSVLSTDGLTGTPTAGGLACGQILCPWGVILVISPHTFSPLFPAFPHPLPPPSSLHTLFPHFIYTFPFWLFLISCT